MMIARVLAVAGLASLLGVLTGCGGIKSSAPTPEPNPKPGTNTATASTRTNSIPPNMSCQRPPPRAG